MGITYAKNAAVSRYTVQTEWQAALEARYGEAPEVGEKRERERTYHTLFSAGILAKHGAQIEALAKLDGDASYKLAEAEHVALPPKTFPPRRTAAEYKALLTPLPLLRLAEA